MTGISDQNSERDIWLLPESRGDRAGTEPAGSVMNSVYLAWRMRVSDTVTH